MRDEEEGLDRMSYLPLADVANDPSRPLHLAVPGLFPAIHHMVSPPGRKSRTTSSQSTDCFNGGREDTAGERGKKGKELRRTAPGNLRAHTRDNNMGVYDNEDAVQVREISEDEIERMFAQGEATALDVEREGDEEGGQNNVRLVDPDTALVEGVWLDEDWDANLARMKEVVRRVKEREENEDGPGRARELEVLRVYRALWMELQSACLESRAIKPEAHREWVQWTVCRDTS